MSPPTSRLVPVPERARSAHAVFSAEASASDVDFEPPSPTLLRHFGATDDQLALFADRPHCRVILTESPLAEASGSLVDARREALDLATSSDGVVVDLTIPRIVSAPPKVDLAVASQWVAFDLEHPVLRSRGLENVGLPELRLDAAEPERTPMVLAVATGVAHRLLTEWPENDPVGPASITLRDVAVGFGDPEADSAPVEPALEVLISYTDGVLAVTPQGDLTDLFSP